MAKVHQFPSKAKHRITHGEQTELHVCVKHLWFGVIPLLLLRPVSNALSLYQLQTLNTA